MYINNENPHRKILEHIDFGRENAVPMKELSRLLGVSERDVRRLIERARIDNFAILSSEEGYFLPATWTEICDYCARTALRIQTAVLTFAPIYRKIGRDIEIVLSEVDDEED